MLRSCALPLPGSSITTAAVFPLLQNRHIDILELLQVLRHGRLGELLIKRRLLERLGQRQRVVDAIDVLLQPASPARRLGERHETRHEAERQLTVLALVEHVDGAQHDLGAERVGEAARRFRVDGVDSLLVEHAHGDAEEGAVDELLAAADLRRAEGVVDERLDDAVPNGNRPASECNNIGT